MKNLNAIPSPYDNVRPKGFFTAKRNLILEKIQSYNKDVTFNKDFGVKKMLTYRLPKEHDAALEEMKVLLPWILFAGMLFINLLLLM